MRPRARARARAACSSAALRTLTDGARVLLRAQASFLVKWVCIENGLEVVVEFFNYLATTNTALGSPVSFYIAVVLNVLMITLELIEVRRTRRHGGKQTPWDRFWFGQVRQGSSEPR